MKKQDKRYRRDKRYRKKLSKGKKTAIVIAAVIIGILIGLAAAFGVMWYAGQKSLSDYSNVSVDPGEVAVAYDNGKTIQYNGKTYELNENIVSAALIGVDKKELGLENELIGSGGQADVIMVAAYDTETGKTAFISIPRDSMTDVNVYEAKGGFMGVKKMQICLSFAYGDGRKKSCDNVTKSVTRLLFGIPVNKFVAMDLEGIPAVNDAVGGVTLTALETVSSTINEGDTVTLHGQSAMDYVRQRRHDRADADAFRRERQIQYAKAFAAKAVSQIKSDFGTVSKLYNVASDYSYLNVSLSEASYLASTVLNHNVQLEDFRTVPGHYEQEGNYALYMVDETALFEMVLDVYYNERA